jgi:hypothetical protein
MPLHDSMNRRFLRQLVRTAAGRAHLYATFAAESERYADLVGHAVARATDPAMVDALRRHHLDVGLHARAFRAASLGASPSQHEPHADLLLLPRVERAIGPVWHDARPDGTGLMRALLLLRVIEERACVEYARVEPALREIDPAGAALVADVAIDTERHLRRLRALAREVAPDEDTLRAELRRIRDAEARAFAELGRELVRFAIVRELLDASPLDTALYYAAVGVEALFGMASPTWFTDDAPIARVPSGSATASASA